MHHQSRSRKWKYKCTTFLLVLIHSETATHRLFFSHSGCLSCFVLPFWKFLHRRAQQCVSQAILKSGQVVMKVLPSQKRTKIILTCIFFSTTALVGNACMVCGGMQSQCEKWSHHVGFVRHWNPKRDWNQQPSASLKAQTSHPGDGFPHESFSSSDLAHCESMWTPSSFPCHSSLNSQSKCDNSHFCVTVSYFKRTWLALH